MKKRPEGAELFQTEEQTDRQNMTKVIVALSSSTNPPKKNMNSVLKIFFVRENEKLLNTWKDETT